MELSDGSDAAASVSLDPERLGRLATSWSLSARQRQVLSLIALGRSNREIARVLGTGLKNVEAHITQILRRAQVASRSQLIVAFWAR